MALRAQSPKHVLVAAAVGAILPVLWLVISLGYYGDLLPTSFYEKSPMFRSILVVKNVKYITSHLFNSGLTPTLLLAWAFTRRQRGAIRSFFQHLKTMPWLSWGVLFQLSYGLTVATHHMLFSLRHFVPYLPSLAFLVLKSFGAVLQAHRQVELSSGRRAVLFRGFLLCLLLFLGSQMAYTYYWSVNGMCPIGEYQELGVRDYKKFMATLRKESEAIKAHWQGTEESKHRHPRVYTYAGGMLPYAYQDAYIYSGLVSYRHNYYHRYFGYWDLVPCADYVHILAPKHGPIRKQLRAPVEDYSLVSAIELDFDGATEKFLVYYNANPEPHTLRPTINP